MPQTATLIIQDSLGTVLSSTPLVVGANTVPSISNAGLSSAGGTASILYEDDDIGIVCDETYTGIVIPDPPAFTVVERCLSYGRIGTFDKFSRLTNGQYDVFDDQFSQYQSGTIDTGTFTVELVRDGVTVSVPNIYTSTTSFEFEELRDFLNTNDPLGGDWLSDTPGPPYIAVRDELYTEIILTPTGGGPTISYPLSDVDGTSRNCTNFYPVTTYSKIIGSDDGGATWTTLKNWGISSVYSTDADINFRDDGFGLGVSDLIDEINIYSIPRGLRFLTTAANRWTVEYDTGRNSTDDLIKVLLGFDYAIDADCPNPDEYELEWYQEPHVIGSNGDTIFPFTLTSPILAWGNAFDLENQSIDSPMQSCTII